MIDPEHLLTLTRRIGCSARASLRGNTPAPLRQHSFAFDADAMRITLKAEVDRPLTEDEREDLACAETEMYADDLFRNDAEIIETLVVVVPPPQPLDPLPGGIVFNRDDPAAVPALFRPVPGLP